MPRKSEFKMLDKTNTRFPTIREARLRAQWRENSKRYYAKKKLEKAIALNASYEPLFGECTEPIIRTIDSGCTECAGCSFPKMCINCVNHSNFHTEQNAWNKLKQALIDSIEWYSNQGDMVTEPEKEQNKLNMEQLNHMIECEREAEGE